MFIPGDPSYPQLSSTAALRLPRLLEIGHQTGNPAAPCTPICGKNAFRFLNFFGGFWETNIILKFLGSLRVEGCFFRWLDILFDFFLETSDLV